MSTTQYYSSVGSTKNTYDQGGRWFLSILLDVQLNNNNKKIPVGVLPKTLGGDDRENTWFVKKNLYQEGIKNNEGFQAVAKNIYFMNLGCKCKFGLNTRFNKV